MDKFIVETSNGRIQGHLDGGCIAFKGIPYAAPPAGEGRFMHARPPKPWSGIRSCESFGAICVQNRRTKVSMDEDCLTLNVWTSDTDTKDKPVLFFVHGGSFCAGSGSDPEIHGANLAASCDCVVITVNYRLGVLGFLDFSEHCEDAQANCGISDIREALSWTYENVSAFGGDRENITMFGQSAGATVCSMLPSMPSVSRYVKRAILMSAGPTLPYSKDGGKELAGDFLMHAGLSMDALRKADSMHLARLGQSFARWSNLGAGTFLPEIDGDLVEEYPIAAAARGQAVSIPMLIGTTREEMSFLFVKPVAKSLEIEGIMDAGVEAESEEVRERIARSYERFGKRGPAIMISDLVFRMGSVWLAEALSPHANVWMYRFDYETPAMKVSKLHAFHSSDIPFVFGNYRDGMAPLMFLFSPSKKKIRNITSEMRKDFMTFARGEALPWDPCVGEKTPAKCYGSKVAVQPCVEPSIKQQYLDSNFRKRSFAGHSNNLRGSARPKSSARFP